MVRDTSPLYGVDRRTFLLLAGSAVAGSAATASAADDGDRTYTLAQGDTCVEITPIRGDKPVKEFYDYRLGIESNPYANELGDSFSSEGTTHLQRDDASVLFLYDGPDALSLVVVHDRYGGESRGGSASFHVTGLPPDGEWAVKDDEYEGDTNYDVWRHDGTETWVDWTWDAHRTDGGAFAGLGDEFAVRVDPAFNEDAALYEEYYDPNGEITDWEALSDAGDSIERVPLALDQPAVLRSGPCADPPPESPPTPGDDPLSVDVEVEPAVVNPVSNGRLPLRVRSDEFDVATVDPETIVVGAGADATPEKVTLVDRGAERPALLVHVRVPDLDLREERTLTLTAETDDGRAVRGTATVRFPPNEESGDDDDEDDDDDDEREDDDDDEREDDDDDEREDDDDDEREDDDDDDDEDDDDEDDDDDDDHDDDEDDDEEDDDEDDDDDEVDILGNGNGPSDGTGPPEGEGRGNGPPKGKGRSKGKGKGKSNGKGRGGGTGKPNGKPGGRGRGT